MWARFLCVFDLASLLRSIKKSQVLKDKLKAVQGQIDKKYEKHQ